LAASSSQANAITTGTLFPASSVRENVAPQGFDTGYFAGGYFAGGSPSTKSTVDRIDYSSDTGTTPTKGPLSAAKYLIAATGNSSFGYFASGYVTGSVVTTVDRIDYSSDTGTVPSKDH